MHNTTIHSSSCNISDLVVKGSVSLPANSLVVSNINNLQNVLNSKQDNITLKAGTNVTISQSANTWTINSHHGGGGGGNYSNTDNYLVINNSDYTINLSNHIFVTDISCGNLSAKNLSLVDNLSAFHISCDEITAKRARITSINNNTGALFGTNQLPIDYNHFAVRQVSNGQTFINSYGSNLILRKTEFITSNGKSVRTNGDVTWDGTTLSGKKLKFTDLDVTNGSINNLCISSLIIPNNSLTTNKITNLNTCLNSLSNNKQDNITLIAGANIQIVLGQFQQSHQEEELIIQTQTTILISIT